VLDDVVEALGPACARCEDAGFEALREDLTAT
jgi:hypothetical protein